MLFDDVVRANCRFQVIMWARKDTGEVTWGGILAEDLARQYPTPFFAYDLTAMQGAAAALTQGFGKQAHVVAYAVKANPAGSILRAFARACLGADVVSGGELLLAIASGIAPEKIVFSGVAKTDAELQAAIAHRIGSIHIESVEEIARVQAIASAAKLQARVSLRLNPGIETEVPHAHIATGHDDAKFGITLEDFGRALTQLNASPSLSLCGLSCHIGSQLTTTVDYLAAAQKLVAVARDAGLLATLSQLDFGGGFGIDYGDGCTAAPSDFARAITALLQRERLTHVTAWVEPGRSLVASSGLLVSRVIMQKGGPESSRRWLMLDAGMNDLLRPALYGAKHRIESFTLPATESAPQWSVVGPVCESSDDFGKHPFNVPLPTFVGIRDAGAYGRSMSSQYNGRALAGEVFIEDGKVVSYAAGASVEDWISDRLKA